MQNQLFSIENKIRTEGVCPESMLFFNISIGNGDCPESLPFLNNPLKRNQFSAGGVTVQNQCFSLRTPLKQTILS